MSLPAGHVGAAYRAPTWTVLAGANRSPGRSNSLATSRADGQAHVYVADTGKRRIQRLASTGSGAVR